MTCPHCREKILSKLSVLRFLGLKDQLKEVQRKYLLLIRKGNWKVEKEGAHAMRSVYCILEDIEAPGHKCCYHLGFEELRRFFNKPKERPEHQDICNRFWALRAQNVSIEEACRKLECESKYKFSTIRRIAYSRN